MKRSLRLFSFLFFLFISSARAQDFTGQWKGQFIDKSTSFSGWGGDKCEYVLELECNGKNVTGYSYTYFSEGGKRYYTICKLKGTLNKASKYVEVTEFERTKTNVPVNIRNCFQVHKLSFYQQGDQQTLEGTWVPAPNQAGDCGFGNTVLTRRMLQKNSSFYNKKPNNNTAGVAKPKTGTTPAEKNKPQTGSRTSPPPPLAKKTAPVKTSPVLPESKEKEPSRSNNDHPETSQSQTIKPEAEDKKPATDIRFEKRNSDVLKTIEIDNKTFTVDLYDNGEIDGDSISLFFNGKLILSHKRLSDKALSMKLNIDETRDLNELIMYAENLGSIPPNTALMVVHDGDNRYEVRISSDLQKSGTIRFIHRPATKAP